MKTLKILTVVLFMIPSFGTFAQDSTKVEILLEGSPEDMILTLDGQEGFEMDPGDKIFVKKSANDINMISFANQSYYKILKTRLKWSGGR